MKRMKSILCILLCTACLLSLVGCGKDVETLSVRGLDFDELEAEEISDASLRTHWDAYQENHLDLPLYKVYNESGVLCLNVAANNEKGPFSFHTGYHQLFAEDLGEWGGWVSVGNFYSELSLGNINLEHIITHEGVIGIYAERTSNSPAYIVTCTYNNCTVYRFTDLWEEGWELETVTTMKLNPTAALLDDGQLIIAAGEGLYSVDVETGEQKTLYTSEGWWAVQANSMVKIGDRYYIGSSLGVLEYRISDQKMLFFPYPKQTAEDGE